MNLDPAPPRAGVSMRWHLLAIAFAIGLCALAAVGLWHLRVTLVQSQARELRLLALALADGTDRGLDGVQDGLQAVRAELARGALPTVGPDAAAALQTRAALIPWVDNLWLMDAAGNVLSASRNVPPPAPGIFYPALDRLPEASMAISAPFSAPGARAPSVAVAYRFEGAGAAGRGWIIAALPAVDLLGAFSIAAPAGDARMAVLRGDGLLLAGEILGDPDDAPADARPFADRDDTAVTGFSDDGERLLAVRKLPQFGVKIVLTRQLQAMLAPWRQAAQAAGAGLGLFLLLVLVAVYLVRQADDRRARAQAALQLQTARAGKLEALGTLAGGVAHDFNNVLSAILGYAEMIEDKVPAGSDQERHVRKVLHAALRGKALVERVLAFGRGGGRVSTVFQIAPVVDEVLALLAVSLRSSVAIERVFDAPAARMRGDPTQVFEAVLNLCTNAMQAMPQGGRLCVTIRREHLPAPRVLSHGRIPAGEYVRVSVEDDGAGMSSEVLEHLFEPFYTTRAAESGTGLGLAVVHGVVAECGGAVDVRSAPGHGATFTLYFPEALDAAPTLTPQRVAPAPGRGEALLVVDDDPAIVSMAVETLADLGYQASGTVDPAAALRALGSSGGGFAAVITDEVMPGMSGTELTRRIRAQLPSLPVLLVSGYGGASLAARATEAGVTRLLGKPLQRAELASALDEVLH